MFLSENSDRIVWWWKNGENKQDYFGIKYKYAGAVHTFYPDYLMQLADGQIAIIETKDLHDQEGGSKTKAKAERLQGYIQEQKGQKLFGGIAIEKSDGWKINQETIYNWDKCEKNDWGDWLVLKF